MLRVTLTIAFIRFSIQFIVSIAWHELHVYSEQSLVLIKTVHTLSFENPKRQFFVFGHSSLVSL